MGFIARIRNPELFQGVHRRRGYFEGWYFKLLGADDGAAAAVIPGVALGRTSSDSHAFVQFIVGGRSEYFRYPLGCFEADARELHIRIGGNVFSREGVSLNLRRETCEITGSLQFTDAVPFPKTLLCPGVMGPFGYVPCMECYHGVASLRHGISGSLLLDGRRLGFDGGTGYIEKDWGRSFPRAWVWLQGNCFQGDAAFLFSLADIPWLGRSFRGFFAILWFHGELHRFATYTGARLARFAEYGGGVEAVITGRGGRLEISATPGPGGMLKAPKNGRMDRLIEESNDARIAVKLMDTSGAALFEGESRNAGMEKYNLDELLK